MTSTVKTVAIFPKHAFSSDLIFVNFNEISIVHILSHSIKNPHGTKESKPMLERRKKGLTHELELKGVVPLIFPRRMCILDNQGNT